MQLTPNTSSSSSPSSDASVKKKRRYPPERRRTQTKKQRYPGHQITLDLNNQMAELSHPPRDVYDSRRPEERRKAESIKRDAWKDMTDISMSVSSIEREVKDLGPGFGTMLANVASLKHWYTGQSHLTFLHSYSDYVKVAGLLDSHFSLFDQETKEFGLRFLTLVLENSDNEEVDELIEYLNESLDFFEDESVVSLIRACRSFWLEFRNSGSSLSARDLNDIVSRGCNLVSYDSGKDLDVPSSPHPKRFNVLLTYLQSFRSAHWEYRKRIQSVLETLNWYKLSVDGSHSAMAPAPTLPWMFQPAFTESSLPDFTEKHNCLLDSCQQLLAAFKSYTNNPVACIRLYRAFRMQTIIWDHGMKAYIDALLAIGQKSEAISYIDCVSERLNEFQKCLPELNDEWFKMRQGLDFYKGYLQDMKGNISDEQTLLTDTSDEAIGWPPPLNPPVSGLERWPLLKSAFDIYEGFWNAPLSSTAELVLKGWSWVGQGFGFRTYTQVSWLICVADVFMIV